MRSGLSRTGVAERKQAVREFFAHYYWTYHELVRGGSDEFDLLFGFFAVPMTVTTRETHRCLRDAAAVRAAFSDNIRRLRAQRYERAIPVRSDFRILNDRACLAEVDWVRTGSRGEEVSRLRMAYLVAETAEGLRIVSMVVLGEPPEDVRVLSEAGPEPAQPGP